MKGVFYFNQVNDVVFQSVDHEFHKYILNQALTKGLISTDVSCDDEDLDPNLVMQLFSPLLASQRFMQGQTHNPYHAIKCQNGFTFVFQEFSEYVALAVNGDGSECESFLQRKLLVLQRILCLLFGPNVDELRPARVNTRIRRWAVVSGLLDRWHLLYSQEQSYLFESVERLHVNQALSTKCIRLLDNALTTLRTAGDKHALHAMLLVHSKLLSLYSSRDVDDLDTSDILILILLVNSLFPHAHPDKDRDGELPDPKGETSTQASSASGDDLGVEYMSSDNAPSKLSGSNLKLESESKEPTLFSPSTDTRRSEPTRQSPSATRRRNSEAPVKEEATRQPSVGVPPPEVNGDVDPPGANRNVTVFLRNKSCPHTPFALECCEIIPGVFLLLASEIPKSSHASLIVEALSSVRAVLHRQTSSVESLDLTFKKLLGVQKHFKGVTHVEKLLGDIHTRWVSAKRLGVAALLTPISPMSTDIPPRLEGALTSLAQRLKDLFRTLFFVPRKSRADVQESILNGLDQIQARVREELWDYQDYLNVKAVRNLTMTNYLDEFPGMVHFVYVDRTTDQLTAPSFNIPTGTTEAGAVRKETMTLIRDKVWKMGEWVKEKVASGYVSLTARDDNFFYSYFLWFEDAMGNPLAAQKPHRGHKAGRLVGTLTGEFYKQLVQDLFPKRSSLRHVCCYELLCVHSGLVPTQYVLSHCRKLAAMLWESNDGTSPTLQLL